jgi:hypothetical protein
VPCHLSCAKIGVVMASVLFLSGTSATAEIPRKISYQARLTDIATGEALASVFGLAVVRPTGRG